MHRRKLLLAAFCCFLYIFGRSQQFNTWYFGNAAGITFNPGGAATPHFLTDGTNSAYEGNSSICDDNGNILFYANGTTVFNRRHQVIERIFLTKKENGWDGTINGQSQNGGIYIWMLKASDEHSNVISKKGIVALIR